MGKPKKIEVICLTSVKHNGEYLKAGTKWDCPAKIFEELKNAGAVAEFKAAQIVENDKKLSEFTNDEIRAEFISRKIGLDGFDTNDLVKELENRGFAVETPVVLEDLTVDELKNELTSRGIPFETEADKKELVGLLKSALEAE